MDMDYASAEKAVQLEAQLIVYRDALQRMVKRLMDRDSEFARIVDAVVIGKIALGDDDVED
jgi:nitrate reductase assembly molybdenum cofactor insertion protein NarJ